MSIDGAGRLSLARRQQQRERRHRVGEQRVVVDERHVGGGDDAAREPAPVQRVDGRDGGGDGGALAVHVALRRRLVHVHVQHAAVLVALADHVVADLDVPVRVRLAATSDT